MRDLRKERGWSVQQFADACAVAGMESLTRSTLAKLESGVRGFITVDELVVIASVLDLHPAALIDPSTAGQFGLVSKASGGHNRQRDPRAAVCPFCFSTFDVRNVLFRCMGGFSRRGRPSCKLEIDHIANDGRLRGPLFRGKSRQSSAECPSCGIGTTTQVCPICHHELWLGYAQSHRNLIAVVGFKNVGKSVYITALLHELRTSVGEKLKVSATAIDDQTSGRYFSGMEDPLFSQGRLSPATVRDSDPLVFDLAWHRRFNKRNLQHSSLVLYDPGGESVRSRHNLMEDMQYLRYVQGIIFAIEPWPIAEQCGVSLEEQYSYDEGTRMRPGPLLSSVAQVIRSQNSIASDELIDIPLAVMMTKVDLLRGCGWLGKEEEEEFFNRELHLEQITHAKPWVANGYIGPALRKSDQGELQRLIDANFSKYAYFAVSALGASPDFAANKARLPVTPLKVTDPLMWLLDQLQVF